MDFIPGGELSRRIREGDVSAESELIRQFEPGLRVLLRRRTGGDRGLLQDLVQETLLIVLQRLRGEGVDDPQRLAAFAAQTARNLAIASLRKAERQRTDVDSEATERNADPARGVESRAADHEAALAVRAGFTGAEALWPRNQRKAPARISTTLTSCIRETRSWNMRVRPGSPRKNSIVPRSMP